ncbi:hypothetical protein BDV32DRAFT_125582 [Aspergillus pseudonomiae]|nr:hypothetical protein BDV32DRAFT_125582 [Aspergillus pseudonomiae]
MDPLPQSSVGNRLCKACRTPTVLIYVKPWNPNGHGGRPFFKCPTCGRFHSWADTRGVLDQNPLCQCGRLSRISRANPQK